ncbi:glycosyltransferase family 2 protein [Aliiroseovarius subalbicans]|uniref:glycosyltransferase family 2 protein n=1 Tax=Aliiroseovarius subalbicans TaxID=2925840 RepID=UPI001F593642|nr:glycosyltransferase family 2 protein [Aliiroseovarius subalbicans]MCI2401178.1 glycosyltransferase [Aliiroseovarius subalbicans]
MSQTSPTVSVILPVYNRSSTLENAARSVLTQSYADLELIIVDDASTEDLRPIIDKLADPRVHYKKLERNGGASVARNIGLQMSRGAFIAFQDSDDLWLPWKLQMQIDKLNSLPREYGAVVNSKILYGRSADGYGSGMVSVRPAPDALLKPEEDQVQKFLIENRISLQNTLFRRDCYPSLTWFDNVTRANADWAFSSSLAQHTRIYESAEPVLLAFISPDSISKNWRNKTIGLIRILKRNREVFMQYPTEYAWNLWRIGRMLQKAGKQRTGKRFCRHALIRRPQIIRKILARKFH